MKKLIIVFTLLLAAPTFMLAQTEHQKKIEESSVFFQNKDYPNALKLLRELHTEVDRQDSTFATVAYGLSSSLFYALLDAKKNNNRETIVLLAPEFITVLEQDKDVLDTSLQEKKYWAYKDIIVAYFGLGQREKAKPYQQKLYDAYKKKELPDGIDQYYNFEKSTYNNQNVWGYEWYAELGDKETEGSFSKHVYYIYSQDKEGKDKDLLFTLETVKVHKFTNDEPDFVLTKRVVGNGQERSNTIWSYTFENPVDYEKLHNAVFEFLAGDAEPTTTTIQKK